MRKRPRSSKINFENEVQLTEQSHSDRCDIKKIVANARRTGMISHLNHSPAQYMDLPNVPSFHEAMNIIATASSTFESMPADFRQDMNNDPAEFLEFIQDPENIEEIEAYGFSSSHLTPPEAPVLEPAKTPVQKEQPPSD